MAQNTPLGLSEEQEAQKAALIKELKKGEESGFVKNFDWKKHLKYLKSKHKKK